MSPDPLDFDRRMMVLILQLTGAACFLISYLFSLCWELSNRR